MAAGKSYTEAARAAGRRSGDAVSDLVARFNREGVCALGLSVRVTLPEDLPPLRMLLVLDNLTGHKSPELLLWMFSRGVMVLYTPLGASWLNMTESMQRIIVRRTLEGHHPESPEEIVEWLEAAARGWNLRDHGRVGEARMLQGTAVQIGNMSVR